MAALIISKNILLRKSLTSYLVKNGRTIATSKKNSDSSAATCTPCETEEKNNWVSYGFDYKDQEEDTSAHHASFFFSVTLCLVFGSLYLAYTPVTARRDWAQREAFIELRRREKAGLPAISRDYVDAKTICLPSKAELEKLDVII